MATSSHIGFTYVSQAQTQKEVTVNEALEKLDAILNTGVIDKDLSTPPGAPTNGDVYIVGSSPTGDWSGQAGDIAYYEDAWKFIDPKEGLTIWVSDENILYTFDGTNWIAAASTIQNALLLGVNTTADATNKLAVASSAILFDNIGNGTQIKLNKNAASDINSFLYQTNFSGRAEFGCIGDDDFTLKVSPDNFSSSYDVFVVDKDNGQMAIKETMTLEKNVIVNEFIRLAAATELTISSGSVTATQSHHKIDTESDAASDDLETIAGGSEGDILIIEPENAARTIVVKHNIGNILLFGAVDISLDDYGKALEFIFDGTNWIEK